MRSSVVHLQDPRRAGAARDAALARMGRAKRLVTVSTLGLAAAFTALADGATPAYNKHGGAVAARAGRSARTVVIHPSSAWPHRKHRRRRHHPSATATSAGSAAAPATASTQPAAPASTPPAASPAPQQVQPPPAAPAPTQQAPATTSGGS
jgi:hypothetical protein